MIRSQKLDRLFIKRQSLVNFANKIRKKSKLILLKVLNLLKFDFPMIRKYRLNGSILIQT